MPSDELVELPGLRTSRLAQTLVEAPRQWCVVLVTDPDELVVTYGPMPELTARRFAQFVSSEINPAKACPLFNPSDELLNFYTTMHGKAGR